MQTTEILRGEPRPPSLTAQRPPAQTSRRVKAYEELSSFYIGRFIDPLHEELEQIVIRPRRAGVEVQETSPLWMP